ncbi:hypothetical protein WMY93_033433 [Mugilogobius chulae]|uniref:Uncharacterized protein n=1 Tax=Mugilogobius chulae TaxID=88201 RepID=A0AAW0MSV6_9GOBI
MTQDPEPSQQTGVKTGPNTHGLFPWIQPKIKPRTERESRIVKLVQQQILVLVLETLGDARWMDEALRSGCVTPRGQQSPTTRLQSTRTGHRTSHPRGPEPTRTHGHCSPRRSALTPLQRPHRAAGNTRTDPALVPEQRQRQSGQCKPFIVKSCTSGLRCFWPRFRCAPKHARTLPPTRVAPLSVTCSSRRRHVKTHEARTRSKKEKDTNTIREGRTLSGEEEERRRRGEERKGRRERGGGEKRRSSRGEKEEKGRAEKKSEEKREEKRRGGAEE